MSENDTTQPKPEGTTDQSVVAYQDSPAAQTIEKPKVAAPENALIGDENQPDPRKAEVTINSDSVPAQVTGPPAVVVEEVPVHETFVTLDEVITDSSSPLAVQVPDAGRGTLALPIHALSGKTVEEVFAEGSDESS